MEVWQFDAIGTSWRIGAGVPLTDAATDEVVQLVDEFDRVWSRFRPDSVITQIAAGSGEWELPVEAVPLFDFYDQLVDVTDGGVNPLIGQTLADLGYDATYSLVPVAAPTAVPAWASIERRGSVVRTAAPVMIDVGAAGKGLLVDLVSTALARHVDEFTVDASGDLLHRGAEPLRVALEHPADPTRAIGVAELDPGRALCASATNRRSWGQGLHHVLDGRTGRPAEGVVATWVVADTCMAADGLATAHFLAEPRALMGRFQHEYASMHADGHVEWSSGFPGEVFA